MIALSRLEGCQLAPFSIPARAKQTRPPLLSLAPRNCFWFRLIVGSSVVCRPLDATGTAPAEADAFGREFTLRRPHLIEIRGLMLLPMS